MSQRSRRSRRVALIGAMVVAAALAGLWQDVRAAELQTNGATAPNVRQDAGRTLSVDSLINPVLEATSRIKEDALGLSLDKTQTEGKSDSSALRENVNNSQSAAANSGQPAAAANPVAPVSGKPEAQPQESSRMPFTVRGPEPEKRESELVSASSLFSPIAEIAAKVRNGINQAVSSEARHDGGQEEDASKAAERQRLQRLIESGKEVARDAPPAGSYLAQATNVVNAEGSPRRMPFTVQGLEPKKKDNVVSFGNLFSFWADKPSRLENAPASPAAGKSASGIMTQHGGQEKQAQLQPSPSSQSENAKPLEQAPGPQATGEKSAAASALTEAKTVAAPPGGDAAPVPPAPAASAASPSPSHAAIVPAPELASATEPLKKMPFQVKPAQSNFVEVEPDLAGMVFKMHSSDVDKLQKTAEMRQDEGPGNGLSKQPHMLTRQEIEEFGKRKQDADILMADDTRFIRDLVGNEGIVTLNVPAASLAPDIMAPIGLDEAVLYALRNNNEIKASSEKTLGSKWDKMAAYAEMLPSISMSYATGKEHSAPASYNDLNGDRMASDDHARQDVNVGIKQPLFDPAIIADMLEADDKLKTANYDDHDARQGVASDTVATYYKLVQARIAMTLADQYKEYLDALAKRIVARVEGGGATQADLERIKSRAALAQSARIEAIGDYESNLSDFKRLTRVVPVGLRLPDSLAPDIPANMQDAMEKAVRSNPTYLSSLGKADTAANERNKIISAYIPKLSLQYHDSESYNAGGSAKGNPVDGVYPTQKTTTLMLVAEWELGSAAPVAATFASAARQREMKHRATDVRMRLEQSVRAGYTAVNAASERILILRDTVNSNERIVKMFGEQYENGARSLFELLDAYEQLYNTRLNLVRVTLAKAQALYQIRKQMGELVPAIAVSVRVQDGKR